MLPNQARICKAPARPADIAAIYGGLGAGFLAGLPRELLIAAANHGLVMVFHGLPLMEKRWRPGLAAVPGLVDVACAAKPRACLAAPSFVGMLLLLAVVAHPARVCRRQKNKIQLCNSLRGMPNTALRVVTSR